MTFMSLGPCCLQGNTLTGTPRGELQKAGSSNGVHVDRYFVKPAAGSVDPKAALLLFYDVFGFSIILADRYADSLGVDVFVPDYIPNAPPGNFLDAAMDMYPGEHANQGWLASIWGKLSLLKLIPYLPHILDRGVMPLVDKAVKDLQVAGYERIVAVGYCRGGSMITYLMGKGDDSPLVAGAIFHPGFEPERWPKFTKPTWWGLPGVDHSYTPEGVEKLKAAFKDGHAPFEVKVYPDTVHGFAARPSAKHEHTQAMFNEANDDAIVYLKRELGLGGATNM